MTKTNMGRIILGGIIAGIVLDILGYIVDGILLAPQWTAGMTALGKSGDLTMNQIVSDPTGETAWRMTKSLMGGDETAHLSFTVDWLNPDKHAAWLQTFQASFWQARLDFWYKPMVVMGLVALIFRPNSGRSEAP